MQDENFLYQHKQMMPGTKSHTVKREDLENLRHHAIDDDKQPCYIIEYDDRRWYMILEDVFNELTDC